MKLRNVKYYLSIGSLSLFSWWLVSYINNNEWQQETVATNSAEYFSNGYTKWQMDELGQLKNKFIADKVVHYTNQTTFATKPVMFFYNEKTPPWVIQAAWGALSPDGKNLWLKEKTVITRAKAENVRELIINTSNLSVKIDTSYAETNDWAELISPPHITTGTGMKAVFAQPIHLELLANVKGKYEKTK